MSDFSIDSASLAKNITSSNQQICDFSGLSKEYNSFKKKMQKTDFSNSSAFLEKELSLLSKLKDAAQREGRKEEIEKISQREQSIYKILANNRISSQISNVYYRPVSFSGKGVIENTPVYEDYIKQFKEIYEGIDGDENAKKIIIALGKKNLGATNIEYILKKCMDNEGVVSPEKARAVEMFASSDFENFIIPQLLEEFSVFSEKDDTDKINFDGCQRVCDFKKNGMDSVTSLKFTKFLSEGFANEEETKAQLLKMYDAGINHDLILKIMEALKIKDYETGLYKISNSSIQSLTRIKKALSLTRVNEKNERENPINKRGVQKFSFGDNIMIIKDGKITYVSPVEGESVYNLQQQYDNLVSEIEDNLLYEFTSKYKKDNGEIDKRFVRALIALRGQGNTYGQLMPLLELCTDENGNINKYILDTVGLLKNNGVLSEDIPILINSFETNLDGSFDEKDLKNTIDLTAAAISGEEIANLLSALHDNDDFKDFILYFAQVFNDKISVDELSKIVLNGGFDADENAIDILYNLFQNFSEQNIDINSAEFINYGEKIINAAKNIDNDYVDEDGAGIVSIMCRKKMSPEDIIEVLDICHDQNGIIDERLAEISWDMAAQNASSDEIIQIINFCKGNNQINYDMVEKIITLFDSGVTKEELSEYI